jgi:cytochrome d ubiquinol oxidase subunit II
MAGIVPLEHDAPTLFHGITHRGLPLVLLSAGAGGLALAALWRRRCGVARVASVGAVAGIVVGWGVGQYPWMLVDQAKIADAAAPRPTLWGLVVVVGLAAVLVLPPLGYLLWLTQRTWWVRRQPG